MNFCTKARPHLSFANNREQYNIKISDEIQVVNGKKTGNNLWYNCLRKCNTEAKSSSSKLASRILQFSENYAQHEKKPERSLLKIGQIFSRKKRRKEFLPH